MRRILGLLTPCCVLASFLFGCAPGGGQVTAFTHVNLVPMTGEVILEDQTLLVEGDRIVQVGFSGEVDLPQNAVVIDGRGAYLMPGLADMHIHTRDDWLSDEWPVSPLNLFLANGVTTVRDFGPAGEPLTYALRWRERIRSGELDGPTIYASGKILFASPVDDPAAVVGWNHDQGFDFQKLYSYLSPEDYRVGMATAKELRFYTAGHIPYAVGLESVLSAGMDEIAHVEELDFEFIEFDRDMDLSPDAWIPYVIQELLQQYDISQGFDPQDFRSRHGETLADSLDQLEAAGVPLCTTLVVDDLIVQKVIHPQDFQARPENRYLPPSYMQDFLAGREKHQRQFKGLEDLAVFKYGLDRFLLTELHQAGVVLLLSTDTGTGGMGIVPGYSLHDELRILTENGFTPYEALAAGTVEASKVVQKMVGVDDFGTLEVGKRADLLLLKDNPLQDVAHAREILGVMAAGGWYSQATLEEMTTIEME